jgi:hypothetical protein
MRFFLFFICVYFWVFSIDASWSPSSSGWETVSQKGTMKSLCPLENDVYFETATPEEKPLCLLNAFLIEGKKEKERRLKPPPKVKKITKTYPVLTVNNFLKVDVPFSSAIRKFRILDESNLKEFANKLKNKEAVCRHPEVTAAFVERMETFLPKNDIYLGMKEIYSDLKTCLPADTKAFHRIHMLMGFLSLSKKEWDLAHEALHATSQYSHPDQEPVLFWLGVLQQRRTGSLWSDEKPAAWKTLLKKHPYNYYSILVYQLRQEDPILSGVLRPTTIVLSDSEGDSLVNRVSRLLDFLLDAHQEKLAHDLAESIWLLRVPFETASEAYKLGFLMSNAKFYRGSISYLNRGRIVDQDRRLSFNLFKRLYPFDLYHLVEDLKETSLETNFILSLMRRESAFDSTALSSAGASGLMQVMPGTAKIYVKDIQPEALLDPKKAIQIGTRHLEKLRKLHKEPHYILAAYNAGDAKPSEWKKRYPMTRHLWIPLIPYRETREYVSAILGSTYWYDRLSAKLVVETFLSQLTAGLMDRFSMPHEKHKIAFLEDLKNFYE